jgi:hypothetical protein
VQRHSRVYEAGRPYGLRLPRPLDICIDRGRPCRLLDHRLAPWTKSRGDGPSTPLRLNRHEKGSDMTSHDGRRASQASATPGRNTSDLRSSTFSFRQVAPCSGRILHGHSLPRYRTTEISGTPTAMAANASSGVRKPRSGTKHESQIADNIPFCQWHGRRTRAPAPRSSRIR